MSDQSLLWVIGAGGHGRAVAEAAELSGWQKIRFVDDAFDVRNTVDGWAVNGPTEKLRDIIGLPAHCIVAIGNQAVRARIVEDLLTMGATLETIIHPMAWVSSKARVDGGCAIMAGAVVGAHARLGRGVIVNANATADHDVTLGDFAHLGVGVQLAGGVAIERGAWLQAGCSAGYGVTVDADVVVAPGTALTADASR